MPFDTTETVTVSVTNNDELAAQIRELAANGGGTILVEASDIPYALSGTFGAEDAPIRIVSADPDDPALFSYVSLTDSQNLSFEGLLFDTTASDPEASTMSLKVAYSEGIAFRGCTFVSEADGFIDGVSDVQAGDTLGKVLYSEDFVFEDNDISGYFQGLALRDVTGATISRNSFTQMQGDGIRMNGVVDTLIENNTFADFYGSVHSANHDDMIQLWSTPDCQLTQNLTIRGNIFDSGDGAATQTIFIRNEYQAEGGEAYQNIVIEDNLIYNGHSHGITVDGTEGVTIVNNTLIWNPQATMQSTAADAPATSGPKINVTNSSNVQVTDNLISGLTLTEVTNITQDNNHILVYGDPYHENAIELHLVNGAVGGKLNLLDLAIRPDSPLSGVAGAPQSVFPESVSTLTPLVSQGEVVGQYQTMIYDASLSIDVGGILQQSDATYHWVFSDGTEQTGVVVIHTYDDAGDHNVELTVVSAGGEEATTVISSNIQSDTILTFSFEETVSDDSAYASAITVINADDDMRAEGVGGTGFRLDGTSKVIMEKTNAHLEKLTAFTVAISLASDDPRKSEGALLARHDSLSLNIGESGALQVAITTEDGYFSLHTHPSILGDADWHRIAVTYDSAAKVLALYYDSRLIASTEATGLFNSDGVQPLYLGGPSWVSSTKGVVDDLVMTRSVWSADQIATDYAEMTAQLIAKGGEPATELSTSSGTLHDIVFGEDAYALYSYTPGYAQDYGQATLSQDGTTVSLTGNAWKVIDLEITITEDLMLSFDFEAAALGEIHGIGFVSVDGTIDEHAVFQLTGTQDWGLQNEAWAYGIGSGTVSYDIAVGQNLMGTYIGLALVMDDDANLGGVSSFANIELWRAGDTDSMLINTAMEFATTVDDFVLHDVDFGTPSTQPYAYQGKYAQDFGTLILSEDGTTATLTDNSWKVIELAFDSADNTILSFDFAAEVEGEIHAIGFVDAKGNVEAETMLQLAGTQDWGLQDDAWAYDIGSGTVHYDIALGQYVSGAFTGIALIMDDDALVGADSSFGNIEIVLGTAEEFRLQDVDFNTAALQSYDGQYAQDFGIATVSADGNSVTLTDNSWKVIEMALEVDSNTILSFDFAAEVEGEIHAIGFVDANGNVDAADTFQFAGTQDWGLQGEEWAYEVGSGMIHYEIAVGQYIADDFAGVVLIMDDDALIGADSSFANIELF